MGTTTDAYLVYGVRIESDSLNSDGGWRAEEGTPKWMLYNVHEHDGLRIQAHCSSEFPEFIVCSATPRYVASRGYPESIDPRQLVVPEGTDDKILAYCKKHGLKTEGNVSWLLCSYWG
jgi:hypothetical protein